MVVGASKEDIERLYAAEHASFQHALTALLRDPDAAWEATQEAFARAIEHADQFRGPSLPAWIWRIAIRQAHSEARRRRRGVGAEAPGGSHSAARAQVLDERLWDAIRELPERRRLIVFLRYFADLSYGEIAEVCGVSEGTVAAVLSQAHAQLRRELHVPTQEADR